MIVPSPVAPTSRTCDVFSMELDPLYWLAGILEGEGTFLSGPPSKPNSPIVRVRMTDRDVVARAAALLHRAVTPTRARKAHHKPAFVTQIKGIAAVALMAAVRPVLGPDRQAQVDRALARWAPCRVRPTTTISRLPVLRRIDGTSDEPCALSWLAGLLEGEGAFTMTCDATRRCYPVLSVQMCDAAVIFRAARIFEVPRVTFPRTVSTGVASNVCCEGRRCARRGLDEAVAAVHGRATSSGDRSRALVLPTRPVGVITGNLRRPRLRPTTPRPGSLSQALHEVVAGSGEGSRRADRSAALARASSRRTARPRRSASASSVTGSTASRSSCRPRSGSARRSRDPGRSYRP